MNNLVLETNQLGPYLILEMLDKGGMSLVYKARDQRDNGLVALKLLHPYLINDPDTLKRFQREARLITDFDHPHIVTLRDFGEIDGYFYLAMRYMAGGNLVRHFPMTARFDLEKTLKVLKQVASALDYAHARSVVHRDLKLENILMDENGDCALSDFGIAHVIDGTRYTATGQLTGTPNYMSPEQARGRSDIDYRADLYAFAVLAYRIATGTFPFRADDPLVILHQHINDLPPTPSTLNPLLPRELDYVLWRGLAKAPEHRYTSASEFVTAFEQAFAAPVQTPSGFSDNEEQLKTRESMPTSVMQLAEVVDAPSNRRRAGLVALLLFILVLGMGLVATRIFTLANFAMPWNVALTPSPTLNSGGAADGLQASSDVINSVTATAFVTAANTSTLLPIVFVTNTLRPTQTPQPSTSTPISTRTPLPSSTAMPTSSVVPPTSVPPTSVPTSVPPTSVPPTSVPPTSIRATHIGPAYVRAAHVHTAHIRTADCRTAYVRAADIRATDCRAAADTGAAAAHHPDHHPDYPDAPAAAVPLEVLRTCAKLHKKFKFARSLRC
ncbi:MAG: protein kinase [Anaerolineae bacterium]